MIETRRLILRPMREEDFASLYEIFSDPQTMQYYPGTFDEARVRRWIAVNQERCRVFGFGLFVVVLKETGEVIGDCGVTMQNIHGFVKPELGYHIHRAHQRRGYASEAAQACMEMIFERTTFGELYTYMKHTNAPSYLTALKNGFTFVEEYDDPINVRTRVYRITRGEWERRREGVSWHAVAAASADIDAWMALVARVRDNFPGLETQALMDAHRSTVLRFMGEGRALCVKDDGRVIGVLLLSRKRNMICCMAVDPAYRRRGVGSALLETALSLLDRGRAIEVHTFREEDEKGTAPRALYARFGFQPGELMTDNHYPEQVFILPPA